ncbi:MAG TPA: M56 family metallopeptidase [Thermoanaerobaculia bacterium]|jgi:beta-lactamase regulating signal transducer with metallopeptidase domain|nr:M56 family metallopeptidase [Thermoanaerobaculia bacterium]
MSTIFELAARLQAANAAEEMLLMLLKATLILLIARLLLAAIPRASAATKHVIATAALVAVGLMPLFSVVVPAWTIAVQPRVQPSPIADQSAQDTANAQRSLAPGNEPRTIGVRDTDESSFSTAVAVVKAVAPEPLSALERASTVARGTWKGLIVLTFSFIAFLLLIHMSLGVIGVWYVARKAEELTQDSALLALDQARDQLQLGVNVRLLRSSRISVPVLWGVRNPVLLLPPDVVTWPTERLRVVLLHELAHLKRFDGISLILTRIAVSLFWFHPIAWSLERAGRSECERACDDLVLAGGTKPSEYADHLLAIARSMPTFDPFRSVTLAMSRKSQLEGRLLSILQPHVARRVFSGRRVAIACALAIAVIVPISALRLIAAPPQEQALTAQNATTQKPAEKKTAGSEVEVTSNVDSLEDYFLTKLGKYDKRADRWTRTPRNGSDWYARAYDLYRADRYEEAAAAFLRAAEKGHNKDTALYNAACSYALMGDANRAIPTLIDAIDAGWDDIEKIADDSDFDPIRSDPRFARAIKDSRGEVVNRRLTETMESYNDLRTRGGDDDDWYEVGLDLLRLRKIDDSIYAFEQAIARGSKPGASRYNIACAYSLRGDIPNGMAALNQAIEEGYSSGDKFENDPDIVLLRQQPGFAALKQKAKDLQQRSWGTSWGGVNQLLKVLNTWDDAVDHHRDMTKKYPNSGRAWFNLGYAALQDRDFDTAIAAYRRTLQLGYRPGTSSYNMACAYALQDNEDAAFEWLERAKAAKFDLDDYVHDDEDLDSLHNDPRWEKLTAGLENHEKHFWKHKDKH